MDNQLATALRAVLANLNYIVGCLPHDEAHRSSLEQARQGIATIERALADGVTVAPEKLCKHCELTGDACDGGCMPRGVGGMDGHTLDGKGAHGGQG